MAASCSMQPEGVVFNEFGLRVAAMWLPEVVLEISGITGKLLGGYDADKVYVQCYCPRCTGKLTEGIMTINQWIEHATGNAVLVNDRRCRSYVDVRTTGGAQKLAFNQYMEARAAEMGGAGLVGSLLWLYRHDVIQPGLTDEARYGTWRKVQVLSYEPVTSEHEMMFIEDRSHVKVLIGAAAVHFGTRPPVPGAAPTRVRRLPFSRAGNDQGAAAAAAGAGAQAAPTAAGGVAPAAGAAVEQSRPSRSARPARLAAAADGSAAVRTVVPGPPSPDVRTQPSFALAGEPLPDVPPEGARLHEEELPAAPLQQGAAAEDAAGDAGAGVRKEAEVKTSKYRGVSWNKRTNKWQVTLYARGRYRYFGSFNDQDLAAYAYDRAALVWKGPTAELNWPASTYLRGPQYQQLKELSQRAHMEADAGREPTPGLPPGQEGQQALLELASRDIKQREAKAAKEKLEQQQAKERADQAVQQAVGKADQQDAVQKARVLPLHQAGSRPAAAAAAANEQATPQQQPAVTAVRVGVTTLKPLRASPGGNVESTGYASAISVTFSRKRRQNPERAGRIKLAKVTAGLIKLGIIGGATSSAGGGEGTSADGAVEVGAMLPSDSSDYEQGAADSSDAVGMGKRRGRPPREAQPLPPELTVGTGAAGPAGLPSPFSAAVASSAAKASGVPVPQEAAAALAECAARSERASLAQVAAATAAAVPMQVHVAMMDTYGAAMEHDQAAVAAGAPDGGDSGPESEAEGSGLPEGVPSSTPGADADQEMEEGEEEQPEEEEEVVVDERGRPRRQAALQGRKTVARAMASVVNARRDGLWADLQHIAGAEPQDEAPKRGKGKGGKAAPRRRFEEYAGFHSEEEGDMDTDQQGSWGGDEHSDMDYAAQALLSMHTDLAPPPARGGRRGDPDDHPKGGRGGKGGRGSKTGGKGSRGGAAARNPSPDRRLAVNKQSKGVKKKRGGGGAGSGVLPHPKAFQQQWNAVFKPWLISAGYLRAASDSDDEEENEALCAQWQAALQAYSSGNLQHAMMAAHQLGATMGSHLHQMGSSAAPGSQQQAAMLAQNMAAQMAYATVTGMPPGWMPNMMGPNMMGNMMGAFGAMAGMAGGMGPMLMQQQQQQMAMQHSMMAMQRMMAAGGMGLAPGVGAFGPPDDDDEDSPSDEGEGDDEEVKQAAGASGKPVPAPAGTAAAAGGAGSTAGASGAAAKAAAGAVPKAAASDAARLQQLQQQFLRNGVPAPAVVSAAAAGGSGASKALPAAKAPAAAAPAATAAALPVSGVAATAPALPAAAAASGGGGGGSAGGLDSPSSPPSGLQDADMEDSPLLSMGIFASPASPPAVQPPGLLSFQAAQPAPVGSAGAAALATSSALGLNSSMSLVFATSAPAALTPGMAAISLAASVPPAPVQLADGQPPHASYINVTVPPTSAAAAAPQRPALLGVMRPPAAIPGLPGVTGFALHPTTAATLSLHPGLAAAAVAAGGQQALANSSSAGAAPHTAALAMARSVQQPPVSSAGLVAPGGGLPHLAHVGMSLPSGQHAMPGLQQQQLGSGPMLVPAAAAAASGPGAMPGSLQIISQLPMSAAAGAPQGLPAGLPNGQMLVSGALPAGVSIAGLPGLTTAALPHLLPGAGAHQQAALAGSGGLLLPASLAPGLSGLPAGLAVYATPPPGSAGAPHLGSFAAVPGAGMRPLGVPMPSGVPRPRPVGLDLGGQQFPPAAETAVKPGLDLTEKP